MRVNPGGRGIGQSRRDGRSRDREVEMFKDKTILVTGGTGSFGRRFTRFVLEETEAAKVIIYSRDEYKQWMMQNDFNEADPSFSRRMRFFIGDVRDGRRLRRALAGGVDYVVHAAALKQVPACEYNPHEAIKTNIDGAVNVIEACLDSGVTKVVALSTDKAVNPVNLYGGTKLVSDKLFIAANAYSGKKDISFSIVRYGNVAGSRGSIIPYFRELIEKGEKSLPITDRRMTRFWISLDEGVQLVVRALKEASGGETFISRIPSFKVTDLAEAMLPGCELKEIGIRPGEKLHEIMVTPEDSMTTYDYGTHFIIYPQMFWNDRQKQAPGGKPVGDGFSYSSGTNDQWLSVEDIRERLKAMV